MPKAASHFVAPSDAVWHEAPGTPPDDDDMHWQQQEAMRLKACRQVAALEKKENPQPPSQDPLQYFAQAQADVPLVIDR